MESKSLTAERFTSLARGWTEREYGDPAGFTGRRASLIRRWGPRLNPGDRILELGCGDGALSCFLAKQGFNVVGTDISPGMIEEARRRAAVEGVAVRFEVADCDRLVVEEPFDAVVSFMRAFFTYLEDPAEFLRNVAPSVRKKVIVDWNFRSPYSLVKAVRTLEAAGLRHVEWRPWLIPHAATGASQRKLRGWLEGRLNASLLLLILRRWRYTIHIKGEKTEGANPRPDPAGAAGLPADSDEPEVRGNTLPGSLIQRALIALGQVTR